jgi:hypothetical protein
VQDAHYSVTALFDNAGNVVERYVYDPFGQKTVLDDPYQVYSEWRRGEAGCEVERDPEWQS